MVDRRVEHHQRAYDVRCEWGVHGVELLARECAVVVIVDVLSFCTATRRAVAAAVRVVGGPIGLVPAGERRPDDTLRVAAEDALGAGAIAAALQQGPPAAVRDGFALSPEAQLAAAQFVAASRSGLLGVLTGLASGRELIADGYSEDVRLASDLDISEAVPRLVGGILCG